MADSSPSSERSSVPLMHTPSTRTIGREERKGGRGEGDREGGGREGGGKNRRGGMEGKNGGEAERKGKEFMYMCI